MILQNCYQKKENSSTLSYNYYFKRIIISPKPIFRLSFLSTLILLRNGAKILVSLVVFWCDSTWCFVWWWVWRCWLWCCCWLWLWWWWWCDVWCNETLVLAFAVCPQQWQGWLLLPAPLTAHSPDTPINAAVSFRKKKIYPKKVTLFCFTISLFQRLTL